MQFCNGLCENSVLNLLIQMTRAQEWWRQQNDVLQNTLQDMWSLLNIVISHY
jgi:hypothetical protein